VSNAFCAVDEIIKPTCDDDTINLVPDDDINDPLSLQAQIISGKNHLVFHQRYMVSIATKINFNICGWVFKVRSELAFKDTKSFFYVCHSSRCLCTNFYMDQDSNYIPLKICICGGKNCKRSKDIYGETDLRKYQYTKEVIMDSLDKFRSCNVVNSNRSPLIHEICLINLRFLYIIHTLA
jgi:hypothetical protein